MKAFWAVLLALVALAGVYVFTLGESRPAESKPGPTPAAKPAPRPADVAAPKPTTPPEPTPVATKPAEQAAPPATEPAPAAETKPPESTTAADPVAAPVVPPVSTPATVSTPAPAATTPAPAPTAAAPTTTAPAAPSTEPAPPATTPPTPSTAPSAAPAPTSTPTKEPAPPAGELPPLPTYEEFLKQMAEQDAKRAEQTSSAQPADQPAAKPAEPASLNVKIETKPDGTRLVEGRFPITGEGTKESPYTVKWDYLLSAQEEYVPKDGKKDIPPRIKMLDGTWVRLTGYVAFPLMVQEADELLSMMNQWDGCCIGIPPTPYDAVEVKLITPITGRDRLATFGSVQGRFKVDPHLVGGWLVGLYVMDQATLKPEGYGGFAP